MRSLRSFSTFFGWVTPITFIILSCVLLAVYNWILSVKGIGGYDWDVDHFIYSGQRLLEGDFHWTVEFDDKLPVVQILFLLPGLYENALVWLLLSTGFVVFGAWACFDLVDTILSDSPFILLAERKIAASVATMGMVFLFLFLPGGIYHINPASASLTVISLALIVRSFPAEGILKIVPFFISAMSASVSIGIRPYFFIALIIAVSLLIINRSKSLFGQDGALVFIFFWIFGVGVFGFLTNVAPYIIIGDVNAFLAGISMLSQELIPTNFVGTVIHIVSVLYNQTPFVIILIIIFSVSVIYSLYLSILSIENNLKRERLNEIIILIFILPVLLLALILTKHFWSHYFQLFAPFFAMGVGFFYPLFKHKLHNKLSKIKSKNIWLLTISFLLLFLLPIILKDLTNTKHKKNNNIVAKVAAIVFSQPENQNDFLFLNDMRSHWKLSEPRHGFPHAANTNQILSGKWQKGKVIMPYHFSHPVNSKEYCTLLEKKGPTLIFLRGQLNFVLSCLNESSVYRFKKKLSEEVNLFIRN